MTVFLVVYESRKEVVVVVEAPDRKTAEGCVAKAAESGFLDGDGWEYTDECNADEADDDMPTYVVRGDMLERVQR